MSGCVLVTDAAFAHRMHRLLTVSNTLLHGTFYKHTSKLVRLVCSSCFNLNSTFVQAVATMNTPNHFEELVVDFTELSVSDLFALSLHLPHLRVLSVSVTKADGTVLRSAVTNCPYLQFLIAENCKAVTQVTKDELQRLCKKRLVFLC